MISEGVILTNNLLTKFKNEHKYYSLEIITRFYRPFRAIARQNWSNLEIDHEIGCKRSALKLCDRLLQAFSLERKESLSRFSENFHH